MRHLPTLRPRVLLLLLALLLGVGVTAQVQRTVILGGASLPNPCGAQEIFFKTGGSDGLYQCLSGVFTAVGTGAVAWSSITGTPTTLAGYGITDAVPTTRTVNGLALSSNITLTYTTLGAMAWSNLTSTPTTLSGYGITDAVPSSRTVNSHALSGNITLAYSDFGNLPVANLNSGSGASSSTFWRGDGTWGTPPGSGGTVTHTGTLASGQLLFGNGGVDVIVGNLSGDVATSGSGVTTIGASKVTNAMLAGSIALAKLSASLTGSTTTLATATGSFTTNDCLKIDASGNVTDAGAACGTSSGTVTNTGTLTANRLILGNGTVDVTALGSLGTTTTLLHGNAAGAPSFGAVVLTTDVSGILPVANGGTGLSSGTSGGVPYYSGSTTLASSGALTANLPMIGGGAGSAPSVGTRSGNTTTFATTTGSLTSTHCVSIDASGNLVDNGATCSAATGTVTTTGSPSIGDIAKFSGATAITNATATGSGSVVLATSPSLTTPTLGVALATSIGVNGSLTTNAKLSITGQATSPFVANGNSGTALTVDWSAGNVQSTTLNNNPTFTFSNPADGGRLVLLLIQDSTGSRTVTWPGAVLWPSGTAPTLTTTANKADVCVFIYNATTTSYYGACNLNY